MRLFLILIFLILSFNTNANNISKCPDTFDSYETSLCLKKIKNTIINKAFTINLHDINNLPYAKKIIFVRICNINTSKYRITSKSGQINVKLSRKDIENCSAKINIDIKSEYGICKEGRYAEANWNSLDMLSNIYLKCK